MIENSDMVEQLKQSLKTQPVVIDENMPLKDLLAEVNKDEEFILPKSIADEWVRTRKSEEERRFMMVSDIKEVSQQEAIGILYDKLHARDAEIERLHEVIFEKDEKIARMKKLVNQTYGKMNPPCSSFQGESIMPKVTVNIDVPKSMIDEATKKEVVELRKKLRGAEGKIANRDAKIRDLQNYIEGIKMDLSKEAFKAIKDKAFELVELLEVKLLEDY